MNKIGSLTKKEHQSTKFKVKSAIIADTSEIQRKNDG